MLGKNGIVTVEDLIRVRAAITHAIDVEHSDTIENRNADNNSKIGYTYGFYNGYEEGLDKSRSLVLSLLDDLIDL